MRNRVLGSTLALAIVGTALAAGSAIAVEEDCRPLRPGDEESPIVCREPNWFHAADIPVGNVGSLQSQATPSWSTTPPSGSIQDGEGGAAVAETYLFNCFEGGDRCVNELAFEGTFTGNLDSIAVSLHSEEPLWARCPVLDNCGQRDAFRVVLKVDGHLLYDSGNYTDSVPVDTTTTSQRRDFALTGLYDLLAAEGITHPGFVHAIRLRISPHNSHPGVIYRYGSTDFPSGLVFNPTSDELSSYEIVNA
jgi:hypothetical protein